MSKTIWEKNIDALDERYDLLKEELIKYKEEVKSKLDKGIENAQSIYGVTEVANKKVLYALDEDRMIQLDSLYDTEKLIALWMRNQPTLGYMAKYIFFGFGNGMYVRKVLESPENTVRILVYEPSLDLFIKVMEEFEIDEILTSKRVTLIVEDYFPVTIKEYLYKFVDYRDLEKLTYQPYPNYEKIMFEELKDMDSEIQLMYNTIRATQEVMARYGRMYFYNSLINIPWFIHSKSIISLFYKCPKDIPVFIVASGPSLDKNINELKNVNRKGFIIAADSSVKALLNHHIVPDVYITIDAAKQAAHFEDPRVADIPVICELSSNGNVIRKHKGDIFFINDLNTYVNDYLTKEELLLPVFSSGGSVTNTAFAIATSMGFENIVLVGQDLAYTDNKTHSHDTVRGAQNIDASTLDGLLIEGYDGAPVRSSYEFQMYLRWFEEQIPQYPAINIINATEGGAMIRGAKNEKLKDVIALLCTKEINIADIIRSTDYFFTDNQKEHTKRKMYQLMEEMKELLDITKKGIRDYGKMEELAYADKMSSKEMLRMLKSTNEITNQLEQAPAMYYIQNLMQKSTQSFLQEAYHSEEDPKKEIISASQKGKEYLIIIQNSLVEAIPTIESTLNKVFDEYEVIKSQTVL